MNYTSNSIKEIVDNQRRFFLTNETLSVDFRIEQLKKLKVALQSNEDKLIKALEADLGRSEAEAFFCDIGTSITEINEMIKGLRRWARPEIHFSGLTCFPSILTLLYSYL